MNFVESIDFAGLTPKHGGASAMPATRSPFSHINSRMSYTGRSTQ